MVVLRAWTKSCQFQFLPCTAGCNTLEEAVLVNVVNSTHTFVV